MPMANGYTHSPKLSKGAFVKVTDGFLEMEQTRIPFQYNPETVTRKLALSSSSSGKGTRLGEEATGEPFDPDESFELTLELDATDDLEKPDNNPEAVVIGVADRIAAIESLLYPIVEDPSAGLLSPAPDAASTGFVPRRAVPIALFEWGPGRTIPVRLTSFTVEEQLYSPTLYPIQAKVTVGVQVITGRSLAIPGRELAKSEKFAMAVYKEYRQTKIKLGSRQLS